MPLATMSAISEASTRESFCFSYDGITRTVPFTPPTITSDAGDCTLTSTPLYYRVTDNGINRAFIAVDVDQVQNVINLTPKTNGSGNLDVDLLIEVGLIPELIAGFTTSFTVKVFNGPACSLPLILPTFVD